MLGLLRVWPRGLAVGRSIGEIDVSHHASPSSLLASETNSVQNSPMHSESKKDNGKKDKPDSAAWKSAFVAGHME